MFQLHGTVSVRIGSSGSGSYATPLSLLPIQSLWAIRSDLDQGGEAANTVDPLSGDQVPTEPREIEPVLRRTLYTAAVQVEAVSAYIGPHKTRRGHPKGWPRALPPKRQGGLPPNLHRLNRAVKCRSGKSLLRDREAAGSPCSSDQMQLEAGCSGNGAF